MPRYLIIRGARRAIEEAVDRFLRDIYRYNSLLRGTGYYLKPVHIVTRETRFGRLRYIYIGRYWWRLERRGGRLRWRYVGREKPAELADVPEPPSSPLSGLVYAVKGDDVIIRLEVYRRFRWLFEGFEAEQL